MSQIYERLLNSLDEQLTSLVQNVPPATRREVDGAVFYLYVEETAQQAIVQKLARVISGLRAANLLVTKGLLQERAAICRMLDEFNEDVLFLALASKEPEPPAVLSRYLEGFYAPERSIEDFRSGSRVRGRATVGRKEITNFVANHPLAGGDPYGHSNTSLALTYAFSGYVHGASQHIMEMYNPKTNSFSTAFQHAALADHVHDLWNHFYRGLMAFGFAAFALDDEQTSKAEQKCIESFLAASGNRADS